MSPGEEAWIPTVGQDSHFITFWGVLDPFFGTVLSVASPRAQPPLMEGGSGPFPRRLGALHVSLAAPCLRAGWRAGEERVRAMPAPQRAPCPPGLSRAGREGAVPRRALPHLRQPL